MAFTLSYQIKPLDIGIDNIYLKISLPKLGVKNFQNKFLFVESRNPILGVTFIFLFNRVNMKCFALCFNYLSVARLLYLKNY